MCWALAVVLYRASLAGTAARKLSILLVVEGVTLGLSGATEYFWISPVEAFRLYPAIGYTEGFLHTFGDCAMLALYPPFLGAALNTSLTRPFADKRVQIGIALAAAVLFVAVTMAAFERLSPEIMFSVLYAAMALVFWYALAASIHAWYTATGTARTRARYFALAFGFRDICWSFIYVTALLEIWSVLPAPDPNVTPPRFVVYTLGTLLAVPLIAYGILRTQLFDIDLRIRWTIKQSTVAAAVVAFVYLVSEGASRLLSSELGNVAGLLAAAAVVFFMAPLQRFAERVANAAMPNTRNTPEYAVHRKMQVYEAAVEEALQGGGISGKERALLNRLRDSLGIAVADAEALERDLQAGGAEPTLALAS
jgi:hypothetical protein